MASVFDIESVLNTTLVDYAQNAANSVGIGNVAWANTVYEPVLGTPYITPNFVPASSAPVGVGQESLIREIGFYQISVAVPSDEGKGTLKQIIEELRDYFKQGSVLEYNGTKVRIQRYRVFDTFSSPDWYIQIVRVEWRSDIPN
jgi:hypothetical protein